MGQITEDFVQRMLKRAAAGVHSSLTVWEESQLAHAWLERERLRKVYEPHWANGIGLPIACRCGAKQGAISHVAGCSENSGAERG